MTRTRVSLAVGGAAWIVVMAVYAIGLISQGRENVASGLAYNAPIALLFLVFSPMWRRHTFIRLRRRRRTWPPSVLVSATGAAIIGILVFWPRIVSGI